MKDVISKLQLCRGEKQTHIKFFFLRFFFEFNIYIIQIFVFHFFFALLFYFKYS